MLTLALDTSSSRGGVAILEGQTILSEVSWDREVSHGELLTPALQNALEKAGVAFSAIQLIAIGNGPGSFTGVRVAVNTARALSYGSAGTDEKRTPIMVFDSSEILAAAVARTDLPVLALINAQKNLVFASSFAWKESSWQRRLPLSATDAEAIAQLITEPHLCVGDGFFEIEHAIPPRARVNFVRSSDLSDYPLARFVGLLAGVSFGKRQTLIWNHVHPLYIRASGAEEKFEENRRKQERK